MSADYRYEIKFILNPVQQVEFESWMLTQTRLKNSYPERQVNSLYFDNVEFQGIRDNLAGLPDRAKYRLRWYGENTEKYAQNLKLEIKTRTGRLGSKDSYSLQSLEENFLDQPIAQHMPEIRSLLSEETQSSHLPAEPIFPVLFIHYQRAYFEDLDGIRATIDQNIEYQSVQLANTIRELTGYGNHSVIAELKFLPEQKDNVSALMQHLHLVPHRNSKYLTGMAMSGITNYI